MENLDELLELETRIQDEYHPHQSPPSLSTDWGNLSWRPFTSSNPGSSLNPHQIHHQRQLRGGTTSLVPTLESNDPEVREFYSRAKAQGRPTALGPRLIVRPGSQVAAHSILDIPVGHIIPTSCPIRVSKRAPVPIPLEGGGFLRLSRHRFDIALLTIGALPEYEKHGAFTSFLTYSDSPEVSNSYWGYSQGGHPILRASRPLVGGLRSSPSNLPPGAHSLYPTRR